MTPLLQKGKDAVIIDNTPFENLKKHDIIVFHVSENPVSDVVCHRVYKVVSKENCVYEKGDHHFKIRKIKQCDYIGKVKYIIKNGILFSVSSSRNHKINKFLGILSHIDHWNTVIYLLFHRNLNIDMMCANKIFRDKYYTFYRIIAAFIIKFMKNNNISRTKQKEHPLT